jgi:hypothetical protein
MTLTSLDLTHPEQNAEETIKLLVSLGAKNNNRCVSC